MRLFILSFALLACGCTAVKETSSSKPSRLTAGDTPAGRSLSLEKISASPKLVCDRNAEARKEVRVRHVHIEAFAKGYHPDPNKDASEEELFNAYDKLELARQYLVGGGFFEVAWIRYADPKKAGPKPDGDLGFAKRGFLPSEFDRVAFCIPQGEISPVFRTVFGFHIIQVTDVRY